MKIGIRPVYGRLLAYSIIPLLLVIIGTYAGILILSPNLTADLSNEYQEDLTDHYLTISQQQAINLNATLSTFETQIEILSTSVREILEGGTTTERPSYFHDISEDKITPRPEFSSKYNLTVDFSVSSYYINSSIKFGNYTTNQNSTIESSSLLDFVFISLYPTVNDLLWLDVYFNETTIERSYPFYGPKPQSYDPLKSTFNSELLGFNQSNYLISDPYIDPLTKLPVFSIGKPVIVGNSTEAFVKITILLNHVIKEISETTGAEQKSFLVDDNLQIFAHSEYSQDDIMGIDNQLLSITDVELNSSEFTDLLLSAVSTESTYEIFTDGRGRTQIVIVTRIQGLIFGSIAFIPENRIIGTLNFIEFIVVPVLIFLTFLSLMLILLRRYGFLRNVGLDTLVKLEQSVSQRIEKVSNMDADDVDEFIVDKIKETGEGLRTQTEEKVEDVKDQIINIDKTIAAKINEKLHSFEAKLTSSLDERIDDVEEFIQFSKGKISMASDQLHSMLSDPEKYIEEKGSIFNLEDLNSLDNIIELPNEVNRSAAILLKIDQIEITEFASIIKKSPDDLQKIIHIIPKAYGIELVENEVKLDNKLVKENFSHILQIFYQIQPDHEMVRKEILPHPQDVDDTSEENWTIPNASLDDDIENS